MNISDRLIVSGWSDESVRQDISKQSLHDKYGHMSAIYLCGDEQLQTSHTTEATKLAYKGEKIDVIRQVTQTQTCEKLSCIPMGGPA